MYAKIKFRDSLYFQIEMGELLIHKNITCLLMFIILLKKYKYNSQFFISKKGRIKNSSARKPLLRNSKFLPLRLLNKKHVNASKPCKSFMNTYLWLSRIMNKTQKQQ